MENDFNKLPKLIMDNYLQGMIFFDKDAVVRYANRLFEELTHIPPEEIVGKSFKERFLNCLDDNKVPMCNICPFTKAFEEKKIKRVSCFVSNRSGYLVPVVMTSIPIYDNNDFMGTLLTFEDNTVKFLNLRKMKELEELAVMDPLTKLPNRRFLETMFEKYFYKLDRFADYNFAVVFIDIDNFKQINDTYGHAKGDLVLLELAKIIKDSLRKYDIGCRYGGEEFIVVLQYIAMEKLFLISERIREKCEKELKLPGIERPITISIGATFATKKDSIESLVKRADQLMYRSKMEGKNKVTIG